MTSKEYRALIDGKKDSAPAHVGATYATDGTDEMDAERLAATCERPHVLIRDLKGRIAPETRDPLRTAIRAFFRSLGFLTGRSYDVHVHIFD